MLLPRTLPKFLTVLLFIACGSVQALPDRDSLPAEPIVYHFELAKDIMPPAWRIVKRAMQEAEAAGADVIIMSLDTYGGMVNIADSISQRLLHAEALTLVHIVNNAASAGALISISCDSIYMAPSAQIGAATVVSGTDGEAMPDKYQAYMRAKMRSIASTQGRNPDIAEAMVDEDIELPGIIEAGKTLVFTSEEAVANGFCEGIAEDWRESLELAGISNYQLREFEPTLVDKIVQSLVNPIVSGILLMVIFIGIYAELQTPGVGFPLLAAAIAATLYFAPLYLDGLAARWEIALFFIGVVLLAIEIFVLPGFGIAGVSGLALMVSALVLTMVNNNAFDFQWTASEDLIRSILVVVLALIGSIGLAATVMGSLSNSPFLGRLVLTETQQREAGYTVDPVSRRSELLGARGTAATELRPSGKVDIGPARYDAMTQGEYIARQQAVVVVEVRGNYLLVRQDEQAG
jgi:membrane-bound serine protease (ClpP class)